MEENNRKENITNKISQTIQKTIDIIVEKLQKIEEVDSEKSEQMNEMLENLYNRIKEGKLNTFEILYELIEFQNELIKFLDTDDYKQKTINPKQTEENLNEVSTQNSLKIYEPSKISIFEKLKQLIVNLFRKWAKEGVV